MQLMTTPDGSPDGATLFTLGLAVVTFTEGIWDAFGDRFLTSARSDPWFLTSMSDSCLLSLGPLCLSNCVRIISLFFGLRRSTLQPLSLILLTATSTYLEQCDL